MRKEQLKSSMIFYTEDKVVKAIEEAYENGGYDAQRGLDEDPIGWELPAERWVLIEDRSELIGTEDTKND